MYIFSLRHVLDTLISLAKSFPIYFLPEVNKDKKSKDKGEPKCSKNPPSYSKMEGKSPKGDTSNVKVESDFWDVLVKLDSLSTTSRKGKTVLRNHSGSFGSSTSNTCDEESKINGFEASPLAQLIGLLAHPVVKRSSVLTDRLLRLLALVSLALPEPKSNLKSKSNSDLSQQNEDQDPESTCISPFHEDVG